MKEKGKKPLFYRAIVSIAAKFYGRREFTGLENLPDEPCIVVGNHAQLHGPFTTEKFFPHAKKIWCNGEMMKLREVPAYAFEDFWSQKPKWNRWFFKILSYLIAPICAYFFNRADTIAVYHDARIMQTFKRSVEAMKSGEHVVIFPENRTEFNEIVNEFSIGFVDVARLYYKMTKKSVSFLPCYNAPALRTVVFGKPIAYDPEMEIGAQREAVCSYLKEEITSLAKSLPRHLVTPYANVKKKDYKYSK